VVKLHAGDATAALRSAKALGPAAPRTPRRLGRSQRHRLVVLEWLPGDPLDVQLAARAGLDAVRAAGAQLAALHGESARGLPTDEPDAELRRLAASAAMVGRLEPALERVARRAAERIAAGLPASPPTALTHGDFSADQILVDGAAVALVDLDEVRLAAGERDLGTFLAALERDAARGRIDRGSVGAASEALLDGYAAAAGRRPPPGAVAVWTAAALLHLAPEPFRHREPDWPDQMAAIVARAARLDALG